METPMEPTITSGRQLAQCADLTGSRFQSVCLATAQFDDVNLAGTTFRNANLSDVTVSDAQIGGATFRHIGPPPGTTGAAARQRGVNFEEMQLCDSVFRQVDLSQVRIVDCHMEGMTINGIAVTDLLAAYAAHTAKP